MFANHKEAAHFLGYTVGYLYNLKLKGKGPVCFYERGQLVYPFEGHNGLNEYKSRMRKPCLRVVKQQRQALQLVLLEA